jgi:hypothetical protein
VNELVQLLRQLEASRFYGSVEVKFEAGQVTVIKKTESIKPGACDHRNNRGHNNEARG